jgi:hypothetical protein
MMGECLEEKELGEKGKIAGSLLWMCRRRGLGPLFVGRGK